MTCDKRRVRTLSDGQLGTGSVIYWMSRDNRVADNWALIHAVEYAREHGTTVEVVYNLEIGYLHGSLHQHLFKVAGLKEVADRLHDLEIPFHIISGTDTHKDLATFLHKQKPVCVITDFDPLHIKQRWVRHAQKHITCPLYEVDAHNIIPAWIASDKEEFAAYTFRPKVRKLFSEFCTDFPSITKHLIPEKNKKLKQPRINWDALEKADVPDRGTDTSWIVPGEKAARRAAKKFAEDRLRQYAEKRNDPTQDAQSDLSPYFHYGHIAPQRVAYDIWNMKGMRGDSAKDFLEELVVRRELSDNFCLYNSHYDSFEGFKDWAKQTLDAHRKDSREYVYTLSQFEKAQTHDDLWNAAQKEMVSRGKMHGYMRMYWAKKILEWTKTPEDAMKIALTMNDRYELDGRDPNGYVGVAWSIGGVHDRAWFDRPIFGKIRYMNANGARRKFDIDAYITKYL